ALIARNKYIVTRLHHRYDASNLPEDFQLAPAGPIEGGAGVPKGAARTISSEVKPAKANEMQVRYNHFHPWNGMMKCEKPERDRWGKPPRTYRGLRKIWIAADLARKNRKQMSPAAMVQTPVPSLGLPGVVASGDAGVGEGGADAPVEKKSSCGCRAVGGSGGGSAPLVGMVLALALALRRSRGAARS
ncbi:MAG TPA: hypothetical protein PKA88_20685, partial [Polyangiaceae bacterium]|nr:hypothetical protein [Polyangiaceae bacterium]